MIFQRGGIHRFKEHLAKYPGNVAACKKVDSKVEHTMYQNIEDWNEKKKDATGLCGRAPIWARSCRG